MQVDGQVLPLIDTWCLDGCPTGNDRSFLNADGIKVCVRMEASVSERNGESVPGGKVPPEAPALTHVCGFTFCYQQCTSTKDDELRPVQPLHAVANAGLRHLPRDLRRAMRACCRKDPDPQHPTRPNVARRAHPMWMMGGNFCSGPYLA